MSYSAADGRWKREKHTRSIFQSTTDNCRKVIMTVAEVGIHSSGNGELNCSPFHCRRQAQNALEHDLSKSFMNDDGKTVLDRFYFCAGLAVRVG